MCRRKTVKPNESLLSDEQILAKAYQIERAQSDISLEESEIAATKFLMEEQHDFLIGSEGKRSEEIFSLYRDHTKHEDNLINQRMTWMITIQSFLIATFGFSYQKKLEILSKFLTETNISKISDNHLSEFYGTILRYNIFLIIICVIGIGMSIITFSLLRVANLAIGGLEYQWCKVEEILKIKYLPQITGGGKHDEIHEKAKRSGEQLSNWLTRFFIGF